MGVGGLGGGMGWMAWDGVGIEMVRVRGDDAGSETLYTVKGSMRAGGRKKDGGVERMLD